MKKNERVLSPGNKQVNQFRTPTNLKVDGLSQRAVADNEAQLRRYMDAVWLFIYLAASCSVQFSSVY